MTSITEVAPPRGRVDGDRLAGRLGGRLRRPAGHPRAGPGCRPGPGLRAQCPGSRPAQEPRPGRRRHRPRHHRPLLRGGGAGGRGRRRTRRLPGHHLQLRARARARERLRPAAALDARRGRDLRRQRPGRPGPERGAAQARPGDAGLRGAASCTSRPTRSAGRRSASTTRAASRRWWRRSCRHGPSADRVPGRADDALRRARSGLPATGAGSPRRASRSTRGWS